LHSEIYIVYLGRKGSGLNLTYSLFDELTENGIEIESIILNSNNSGIENEQERKTMVFNFNHIFIISLYQSVNFAFKFIDSIESKKSAVVIFPMSSPLDIFLSILLKMRKIATFRFIHEVKSHLGESWPDPLSSKILIGTATHLVTLSTFVQNQLFMQFKRTSINVQHPVFHLPANINLNLIQEDKYVLFCGRIKKYKGIPTLLKAWEGLEDKGYKLRICGEGKLPEINTFASLEIDNRWLTEIELHSELMRAEIIVFPYVEASQSGLIPIAISKRKKIVITPVGGLIEQVENYENVFVSLDTTYESLRFAINEAMQKNLSPRVEVSANLNKVKYFNALFSYLK